MTPLSRRTKMMNIFLISTAMSTLMSYAGDLTSMWLSTVKVSTARKTIARTSIFASQVGSRTNSAAARTKKV